MERTTKIIDKVFNVTVVIAAIWFWHIWCMMFYSIALIDGDPSPDDFKNASPITHIQEFLTNPKNDEGN